MSRFPHSNLESKISAGCLNISGFIIPPLSPIKGFIPINSLGMSSLFRRYPLDIASNTFILGGNLNLYASLLLLAKALCISNESLNLFP